MGRPLSIMYINITIDNTKNLTIDFYKHSIAKKYLKLIKKLILEHGLDFDHKRCFYSWKTVEEIQKDLDDSINFINNFFNKDMFCTNKTDPEYFNKLHVGFENLNKGYDDYTILKVVGSTQLKECIKNINYCVHNLEHGAEQKKQLQIQWNKNTTIREPLEKNDYQHAVSYEKKHTVCLAYNEVGKSIQDLFHDGLPVNYSGLKNNHYIGPDLDFQFENTDLFGAEFLQWCNSNNIDPYDPSNGILVYPIGNFKFDFDMDACTSESKITNFEIVDK